MSDFSFDVQPSCSNISSENIKREANDLNISRSSDEDIHGEVPDQGDLRVINLASQSGGDGLESNNIPAAKSCIFAGLKCIKLLTTIENKVTARLERVRQELERVHREIILLCANDKLETRVSNWFSIYGMPYFKDNQYSPCPPNQDLLQRKANNEMIIIDLLDTRAWLEHHKRSLKNAIQEEEIIKQINEINTKKNSIVKKEEEEKDESVIQKLDTSQEELDLRIAVIKSKTLKELIGYSNSEYDWMKISKLALGGSHSAGECRSMWFNYLHPKIRKEDWSDIEVNRLVQLAELHKYQNWDKIALELGTNRSAYQCICHFQTRLNNITKRNWSTEEDNLLRSAVEQYRIGSYIPWAKVASCVDGRSSKQVFCRWKYSLDPDIKRGRFTEAEDLLLVVTVKRYGTKDFKRVARFFPGRTPARLRERYNTFLKSGNKSSQWKSEEDKRLLALVKMYGEGSWQNINKHFPTRTRKQLRQRYRTIQNWLKKIPSGSLTDKSVLSVPTREHKYSDRVEKTWNKFGDVLKDVETSEELSDQSIFELRDKLFGKKKQYSEKHPGRKLGQTNHISETDQELYGIFRCSYQQHGGRKKIKFDEEVIQKKTDTMKLLLDLFQAQLNIPVIDDEVCAEKSLFDESDKAVLCKIRDETLLNNPKECGEDCPNHNTTTAIVDNLIDTNPDLRSVTTDGVVGSSETLIDINEETSSSTSVAEMSSKEFRTSFCKEPTLSSSEAAATSSETVKCSSEAAGSSSEAAASSSETVECSSEAAGSSREAAGCSSEAEGSHSKKTAASSSEAVAISREAVDSSNSTDINYFVPPNRASLVGFRTMLLSRRDLHSWCEETMNVPEQESTYSTSSAHLSIQDAHSLWNNRLLSLFFYPALMSHNYFPEEEDTNSVPVEASENIQKVKVKRPRYGGKKRKPFNKKKKDDKLLPPVKKRKYEKSGKYKKTVSEPVTETRRSTRHTQAFTSSNAMQEESVVIPFQEVVIKVEPELQDDTDEELGMPQV